MAKLVKRKKPINKNCLKLVQAVLAEDTKQAKEILKNLVKTNIAKKILKAEQETELF